MKVLDIATSNETHSASAGFQTSEPTYDSGAAQKRLSLLGRWLAHLLVALITAAILASIGCLVVFLTLGREPAGADFLRIACPVATFILIKRWAGGA